MLCPVRTSDERLEALLEAETRGERLKFVLFWGHDGHCDEPGPHWLSQWFPVPCEVADQRYATAEHFMMAEKARLFADDVALAAIMGARTPGEAKALGRSVRGFDSKAWDAHRFAIVVKANTAKFEQNRSLGEYLLATGDRVLAEASPIDRVWGIGLAADDPLAGQVAEWKGLNLLGFALMEVRDRLGPPVTGTRVI